MKTKTWTIRATMETDLFIHINVPEGWDDEQVDDWVMKYGDRVLVGSMQEDYGFGSGGWYWGTFSERKEHDPDAYTIEEARS